MYYCGDVLDVRDACSKSIFHLVPITSYHFLFVAIMFEYNVESLPPLFESLCSGRISIVHKLSEGGQN
jgi:hypothetical protein